MKKLLLIIVLILTHNLHATNCVPVIANIESEEAKKAIFTVITTNSFVSALHPKNFEKLPPEDKEAIIEDEGAFLTRKIKEAAPSAEVLFIPKSLYQLFVCFIAHEQTFGSIAQITPKYLTEEIKKIDGFEDDVRTCSRFITGAKKDNLGVGFLDARYHMDRATGSLIKDSVPDIYSEIDDYCANSRVQVAFWEINDKIISSIKKEEAIPDINETILRSLTQSLIIAIDRKLEEETTYCEKMREWQENLSRKKGNLDIREIDRLFPVFCSKYFIGKHPEGPPQPLTPLKDMISDLVVREWNSRDKDMYYIYRTEDSDRGGKSISDNRSECRAFSFCDGFVGSFRDNVTGSSLGIMADGVYRSDKHQDFSEMHRGRNDCMICMGLPKKALLEQSIPVYIPPIIAMGAALGDGEFYHPRTKVFMLLGNESHFLNYEPHEIPDVYFAETDREITKFWQSLKPEGRIEYEACGTRFPKTLVVETCFYDKKSDSKETDSSD